MKKNLLMWDQTLFKDIEVFDIDYVPEQFEYRDEQIQELLVAVLKLFGDVVYIKYLDVFEEGLVP
ncbi:MAG TPA: hypothetical protein O0X53_07095, partial [Methanocorpusculum sp.]|nr:hypothetical protein [Methanocorpusculum sp.]